MSALPPKADIVENGRCLRRTISSAHFRRAAQVNTDLVQTRLILFAESGNAIPTPFLVILVVYLQALVCSRI